MVKGYDQECDVPAYEWDSSINMDGYSTDQLCTVMVTTAGGNCADFCSA